MPISDHVQKELFQQPPSANTPAYSDLIRIPLTRVSTASVSDSDSPDSRRHVNKGAIWTPREHARFLEGLELFPSGPWRVVAAYVGSKTTRQTITHAQKYRQKIARRQRGLRIAVQDIVDDSPLFWSDRQPQQQQQKQQQQGQASERPLPDGGELEFDLELDAGTVSDLELATFLSDLDLTGADESFSARPATFSPY